jgi:hypothetical protein
VGLHGRGALFRRHRPAIEELKAAVTAMVQPAAGHAFEQVEQTVAHRVDVVARPHPHHAQGSAAGAAALRAKME